jgi:hypothetical protein
MNPFGDDDDDIDTVGLIEKNLEISYLIVDKLHMEHPTTLGENYWDLKHFTQDTPHEPKRVGTIEFEPLLQC